MDKQTIINILAGLGDPPDDQPWLDYAVYGFGAADAPTLVELVEDNSFVESEKDEDVWVPLHAWRALRGLMPAGLAELLGVLAVVSEDDWALEEMPDVLAAAGEAGIEPLAAYLLDDDNGEMDRIIVVEALSNIGKRQPALKARVVATLTHALGNLGDDNHGVCGFIVNELIKHHAVEAMDAIRDVYAREAIDWGICGDVEDIEVAMGLRTERATPRPHYQGFPGWGEGDLDGYEDGDEFDGFDEPVVPQVIRAEPKVGRNDPCPCGSGKKYKKCCMP